MCVHSIYFLQQFAFQTAAAINCKMHCNIVMCFVCVGFVMCYGFWGKAIATHTAYCTTSIV